MQLHFIMTVQKPVHNGFQTATFSGTYGTKPGQTRADVYTDLFNQVTNEIGARPNVMFFSLEPNTLPVS